MKHRMIALLSLYCVCLCSAYASETSEAASHNPYQYVKLSNWSIVYKGPHFDSGMLHRKGVGMYYELLKPRDGHLVAIIGVGEDRRPVLNPSGLKYEYGPIPPLDKLTPAQAEELWGDGTEKNPVGSTTTYKLVSRDKIPFEIELSFVNDRLQKYRVKAERFPVPDASCEFDPIWVQVKSEGQGEKASSSP
jgi:hypothetical protein